MTDKLKCGFSRNSFSRFGDDLCEEILQYLSFEEKIKYECVCKQFKTTVFIRQNVLQIKSIPLNENTLIDEKVLVYYDKEIEELNGISIIERLLQKCKNITNIVIEFNINENNWIKSERNKTYSQLFGIIADNCLNLVSMDINSCYGNSYYDFEEEFENLENMFQYFGSKCVTKLQSIKFPQTYDYSLESIFENVLHLFPNVKHLFNVKLSQLVSNNSNEILLVQKLREIELLDFSSEEIIKSFVNRYVNTIKVLRLFFMDNDESLKHFDYISQLIHLEKMSLKFMIWKTDITGFVRSFEKVSLNCKDIKLLTLDLFVVKSYSSIIQFLKCINNFIKLEYLNFSFQMDNSESYNDLEKLTAKQLKNCVQLKSLNIISYLIEDAFFDNIGDYLPKLKRICIVTNKNLSDNIIGNLNKLKYLESFGCFMGSMITDIGVSNLINNCLIFKSLKFGECTQITTSTIDKFIEIAKQRPKINFNIEFVDYNCYEDMNIQLIKKI